MVDITVAAEILRDEKKLYSPEELRFDNTSGKIEVPVGFYAWQRLREIAETE